MLEVISTLLLNFVADALVSLMVLGPLQEPSGIYPQSAPIAIGARLPAPARNPPACRILRGAACRGRALLGVRPYLVGVSTAARWVRGRAPPRSAAGCRRAACSRRRCSDPRRWPGLAGRLRGERGVVRPLPEPLTGVRLHRHRAWRLLARLRPSAIIADRHRVRRAGGRGRRHAAGRRDPGRGGVRGRGRDHSRAAAGRCRLTPPREPGAGGSEPGGRRP